MIGKTIGEYQIIEFIVETDDAIVYKGFQPSMNRYVAVKVLKPGAARDPAVVQGFIQQGELAAQLQHPNILLVYDTGQVEGVVYQVSQLVEMGNLRDHLSQFYNPQQALALISGLTEGLEYIYSQGYVHGNLTATNIFLNETRRPLMSDFGAPQPAGVSPTPYMAPEQVRGGVVDQRADVYAMGILLYEMLVGETPPAGMIVSPRAKRSDLPEAVERVVLKATAQNPDQRFQSAREFQQALSMALQQPVPVPTITPAPPAPVSQSVKVEQPKGTNWIAIILGVLLLGIICVGAIYFVPKFFGDQEETPAAGQPPSEVTVEIPTDEPRPTKPPEQPTEAPPPEQPTEAPPEQPPEAPPEQPPEEGPPEDGGGIGDICGSVGLVLTGVAFVGVTSLRKRWKK